MISVTLNIRLNSRYYLTDFFKASLKLFTIPALLPSGIFLLIISVRVFPKHISAKSGVADSLTKTLCNSWIIFSTR